MENRIRSTLTGANPGLQATAGRLGLRGAATAPTQVNSFLQLANALSDVAPEIGGAVSRLEHVKELEGLSAGDKAALVELAGKDAEEVKAYMEKLDDKLSELSSKGEIPKGQLPAFQRGFRRRLAVNNAESAFRDALYEKFKEVTSPTAGRTDPEALSAKVYQDFLSAIPADDLESRKYFADAADRVMAEFNQRAFSTHLENYTAAGEQAQADDGLRRWTSYITADTPEEKSAALGEFQTFVATLTREGTNRGDIRGFIANRMILPSIQTAIESGDLDEADRMIAQAGELQIAGGGVRLADTELKSTLARLSNQIVERRRTEDDRERIKWAQAREARREEAVDMAMRYAAEHVGNPTAWTDEQINKDFSGLPNELKTLAVYEARRWKKSMDEMTVEDESYKTNLLEFARDVTDLNKRVIVNALLADAHGKLHPQTVFKIKEQLRASDSVIKLAHEEAKTFFSSTPLYSKGSEDEKRFQTLPVDDQKEVQSTYSSEYEAEFARLLADEVANHGVDYINSTGGADPKRRQEFIQRAQSVASQKAYDLTTSRLQQRLEERQAAHAESARRGGWDADKLHQEIRALEFGIGRTETGPTKIKPGTKVTPISLNDEPTRLVELANDEDQPESRRNQARLYYALSKARSGLSPQEVINGVTDEGEPLDLENISTSVAFFSSPEELEKAFNGGVWEVGGLFQSIALRVDPTGQLAADGGRMFYEKQMAAVQRAMRYKKRTTTKKSKDE